MVDGSVASSTPGQKTQATVESTVAIMVEK